MNEQEEVNWNADAKKFRPRRNVAAIADARIRDINAIDDDESDIRQYHYQIGGVPHK